MIVLLREDASPEQRAAVAHHLIAAGTRGPLHSVHAALGDVYVVEDAAPARDAIEALPGVARLVALATPYQLASRALQPDKTIVRVGSVRIGGPEPVIIAGPCSVEGERQIIEAAQAARAAGAHLLRGGAFKPRTSPYSFQGLGLEGVALLARAGAAAGLPVVTEVMQPGMVAAVAERADVLQVGSRNMQNFPLLRAVGRAGRPVLLKRGFAATIDEWLLAAEYILAEGNAQVILCERGIRGFDPHTRNVLDLACVPVLAQLTHLPVLVDPSHATGHRALVAPLAVAAVAAGADGVMVEMHPEPDASISDSAQAIDPAALAALVEQIRRVRASLSDATVAAER
jgi:3-deoxy-7-phosphoheptulonate synthase